MIRVDVKPDLLRWACERAGVDLRDLAAQSPKLAKLPLWERGEAKPTLKQLEDLAKATHTPLGYLFLAEPPIENLPIPDFRTVANRPVRRPSPNLLDTLYLCQQRQDWYRDFARSAGEDRRTFIGSVSLSMPVEDVADEMRRVLGFDLESRRNSATWTDALRGVIAQADALGVLVMCSGVVLNNTHRKLDPREFRGFAMADDLAPLVFVNGADSKAAQMFTLAHELAHIWLGQSALDDAEASSLPDHGIENWCNRVAAEILVPLPALRNELSRRESLEDRLQRLARQFKVSSLVVLRRIHDAGALSKEAFHAAYEAELGRIASISKGNGGNFYLTLPVRVSKRFARALVGSTLEGQTLYRDAYRLLGISKTETFLELGQQLGMA